MRKLLMLAAVSEALTGLLVLASPLVVIRLLFDSESSGPLDRLTGIGLIALGVACWPDRGTLRAFPGMLTFGLLAALYLVYVGVNGRVGILLWPAVLVHVVLSALLVLAWWKEQRHHA